MNSLAEVLVFVQAVVVIVVAAAAWVVAPAKLGLLAGAQRRLHASVTIVQGGAAVG